jgi:hypothetical protein
LTNEQQKLSKRRAKKKKGDQMMNSLRMIGAQNFTLDILIGVFCELFERENHLKPELNKTHLNDLHSQIAHLISLNYLAQISKYSQLDDTKLKCNIDHQFALQIATSLRIKQWKKYLQWSTIGYV